MLAAMPGHSLQRNVPMTFSIHRRPSWAISENQATPEGVYLDRRRILQGFGLGMLTAATLAASAGVGRAQDADPTADL